MHDGVFLFKLTSSSHLKWEFIQIFRLFEHESPIEMHENLKVLIALIF